jgi:hypothetical protein
VQFSRSLVAQSSTRKSLQELLVLEIRATLPAPARAWARLQGNQCTDSDKPRRAPNGVMRQDDADKQILPCVIVVTKATT